MKINHELKVQKKPEKHQTEFFVAQVASVKRETLVCCAKRGFLAGGRFGLPLQTASAGSRSECRAEPQQAHPDHGAARRPAAAERARAQRAVEVPPAESS